MIGSGIGVFAVIGGLALFIVIGAFLIEGSGPPVDPVVVSLFGINSILVLSGLFVEARKRVFSLHFFHLLALLIFTCIAGLYQYLVGAFPIAGPVRSLIDEIPIAALVVTLWTTFYLSGYALRSRLIRSSNGFILRAFDRPISPGSVHFAMICGLAALSYLASLGLVGAFTRAAAGAQLDAIGNHSLIIITRIVGRAVPLLAFSAAILTLRRRRGPVGMSILPMSIILAIGVMLTSNPFSAARYWFVAVVLGLSLPFAASRFKTAAPILAMCFLGMSILPSMGLARGAEDASDLFGYLRLDSPFEFFARSGDVDAFGMLSLTVAWVGQYGHTWGSQILVGFLFWVPRVFWPTKPVGTGMMVTRDFGFSFTNYSVPIMTEPFVDFGLLGVPVIAFIFGWILSSIDQAYWRPSRTVGDQEVRRLDVVYPFWAGMMLFLTRGDFLSSFGYMVGLTLSMFPFFLQPPRFRQPQPIAPPTDGVGEPEQGPGLFDR